MGKRCRFLADLVVRDHEGVKRVRDVQCMGEAGHENSASPVEAQHSFFAEGTLAFGAQLENGRWVAR